MQQADENSEQPLVKGMVLQALELVGGVTYLVDRAKETPGLFLTLLGKVMSLQTDAEDTNETIAEVVFKGLND